MKIASAKQICLCLILLVATGCQPKSESNSPSSPAIRTHRASQTMSEGSSSGGGGSFGDESSLTILRWAAEDLSQQILNSSPEIYKNLPEGWSRERLAQIIRNVEPTIESAETYTVPEVSRYGLRLMFVDRKRADGTPYITATKLFMDAYSAYEVNSRPKQDFRATLDEVKLKLVHETAHLLGLGNTRQSDMPEARAFAKSLMQSLDSDNVECLPAQGYMPREVYPPLEARGFLGLIYSGTDTPETIAQKENAFLRSRTQAYVFNRPSGRAAVPTNTKAPCAKRDEVAKLIPNDDSLEGSCPTDGSDSASIDVFAPRVYGVIFSIATIKNSVFQGKRSYNMPGQNYFSWNTIDLRKAVLTDEGYRSDYKYQRNTDMNNNFSEYLDFKVLKSSLKELEIETYPPLFQENWSYYRSQGKARISMEMKGDEITNAKMTILKSFNNWLEDKTPNDHNIEVPMTCVRSFKTLEINRLTTAAARP